MTAVLIRKGQMQDSSQLHALMIKLAKFEGYINQFVVTEQDVRIRGFGPKPSFHSLVAERDNSLIGMLVYYLLPFTYDLKPWFFIKELYVNDHARGQRIGRALMQSARQEAELIGCSRMTWSVLTNNKNAQNFYRQLGARPDSDWQGYSLRL